MYFASTTERHASEFWLHSSLMPWLYDRRESERKPFTSLGVQGSSDRGSVFQWQGAPHCMCLDAVMGMGCSHTVSMPLDA